MDHITVVIPTRNRWDRLVRCLDSFIQTPQVCALVVCDGDFDTFKRLNTIRAHNLGSILLSEHRGAVHARNEAVELVADGLLYATDDIVFKSDALETAKRQFNQAFPDDDGLLGFHQNLDHHPAGVGLIGSKFLDRFPERKPFWPGYYHFACQELGKMALKLGKFVYCKEAKIEHFHPAFHHDLIDKTHHEARIFKTQDFQRTRWRQEHNVLWGLNDHNLEGAQRRAENQ